MAYDDGSTSLNAGVINQDDDYNSNEPIMFGPQDVMLTDPPHDLADVAHLATMESYIEDLKFLLEDIKSAAGMNRQFAMEAQRLLPDFNNKLPIKAYTEMTTATGYRAALEEIEGGIWLAIAAIAAAVIAVVVKITTWIMGKKDGGSGGGAGVSGYTVATAKAEIKEDIDELHELDQAVNRAAHDIPQFDQAIERAAAKGSERTDHAIDALLNGKDPLFHDITNHGEYYRTMNGIGSYLKFLDQSFKERLEELRLIIKEDMSDAGSMATAKANVEMLRRFSKPFSAKIEGRDMTAADMVRHIDATRDRVMAKKVSSHLSFTRLYASLHDSLASSHFTAMLDDVEMIAEHIAPYEELLKKMENVCRDLSADGLPAASSAGVGALIRTTLYTVGQELTAFGRLTWQVMSYVKLFRHLTTSAIGLGKEMVRKVTQEIQDEGNEVPDSWLDLKAKLTSRNKAIAAAAYHLGQGNPHRP